MADPTPSPASGATTPCPGPPTTNARARSAIAAGRAVSRPYLSGPGLSRDHQTSAGETLDPSTIAARASAGDTACEASLLRYEHRLARALASVINVIDPEVIVLGGGLSNLARLYDAVPRLWGEFVFSDRVNTRLLRNAHGDSSGVQGAAWLWPT